MNSLENNLKTLEEIYDLAAARRGQTPARNYIYLDDSRSRTVKLAHKLWLTGRSPNINTALDESQ